MNPNIRIQQMTEADIPALAALLDGLVPWEVSSKSAAQLYRSFASCAESAVFVAKEGDCILGTVSAICCQTLAAKFLVIEDVIVAPEYTGKGLGSLLMAAADDFAREHRCRYAILVSSGHRLDAHRFYRKCGFVENVRGFRKGYEYL